MVSGASFSSYFSHLFPIYIEKITYIVTRPHISRGSLYILQVSTLPETLNSFTLILSIFFILLWNMEMT